MNVLRIGFKKFSSSSDSPTVIASEPCLAGGMQCYTGGMSVGQCCDGYTCANTDGATCMMSACIPMGQECYANGASLGSCCDSYICADANGNMGK